MLDKHYDPKLVEQDKYEKWKKEGYFRAGDDKTKTPFSMVIPPPNVTGKLHLGHAWDTTIQDIIARYKKAKGYDVLWLPGMDHAGIATQAKVMARLKADGVDTRKISREDFMKKAWEWKDSYAETIHDQWAKLGLSLDYSRERFTLDDGLNKAVKKVFVDLYNKGLIYRGERIINWDPVQMTALSNIEVIHTDDKGQFFYFYYPVVGTNEKLLVATTRPETMFGDVCLVVNPKDDRYKDYIGKKAINPANDEELPIIGDEYVDIEFGTGVMKCTPAHDPNDFIIGERYHFPVIICMNKDATMNEICGKYNKMDRFECRKALVEDIKAKGLLDHIEDIVHPVGHSERSGAIVEPMVSKQWFVKMKPLAELTLKNQKNPETKVEFVPPRFENVLTRWMENIEDWCISRQLWWGHRIPAYYNKKTGEVLVSETEPEDMENYEQDSDVLDTWFSSGLWPFSTLGWPNKTEDLERYFPGDVLSTGYDIIFFWVSRMIFQSLENTKVAPFKNVIIHGLVRDEQGRKMSKSLGNGVDPIEVIDKYGADALRYFLTTNSTPGLDMRYSEKKVASSQSYLNKIWNSVRYVLSILPEDFKPFEIKIDELKALGVDVLCHLEETIKAVTEQMDAYNFNLASEKLSDFVYEYFCDTYLEYTKVGLVVSDEDYQYKIYNVLYFIIKNIIMMIYPYTPFVAEEMYQALPDHKASIMLESYPEYDPKLVNKEKSAMVDLLRSFISDVRNYKQEEGLAPNFELDIDLTVYGEMFPMFKPVFQRFSFAKNVTYHNEKGNYGSGKTIIHDGGEILIHAQEIDENMKNKLEKDLIKENNEIARASKMLNNPSFIAKAPKGKIETERDKLNEHINKKERIEFLLKSYEDQKNK